MRIIYPLLIGGMIVGGGAAVFADTPQDGKCCTSGQGYGEVMFLAQPKPDGGLAFGLLFATTRGHVFSVAGTARRTKDGWHYEADTNSANPRERCAITINRTADGTYRFSTVEGARCDSYGGEGAVLHGTLTFPPSSRVGSLPASFAMETLTEIRCDKPVRKKSSGGPQNQSVVVTVLGREFHLKPVMIEAPGRPWAEVKGHLPVELSAVPPENLTDQQILKRVERLADDRGKRYGAEIDRLTNRHLKEFLRTEPKANWDWFNLELAGECLGGQMGRFIPRSTVQLCEEFQALDNLRQMLRQALGT